MDATECYASFILLDNIYFSNRNCGIVLQPDFGFGEGNSRVGYCVDGVKKNFHHFHIS